MEKSPPNQTDSKTRLKQAVLAMQEMRARLVAMERARHQPLAVIGLACRMPTAANTPDAFWQSLCDKVDAIRDVPPDRWSLVDYYDPNPDSAGKVVTR